MIIFPKVKEWIEKVLGYKWDSNKTNKRVQDNEVRLCNKNPTNFGFGAFEWLHSLVETRGLSSRTYQKKRSTEFVLKRIKSRNIRSRIATFTTFEVFDLLAKLFQRQFWKTLRKVSSKIQNSESNKTKKKDEKKQNCLE